MRYLTLYEISRGSTSPPCLQKKFKECHIPLSTTEVSEIQHRDFDEISTRAREAEEQLAI
jgi:hypothetical protein